MSSLQIITLTILTLQFTEINSKSLDSPLVFKKLQLTAPFSEPKVNLSLPINTKQSTSSATVKPAGQNRHAKFFYSPSFLTGLGIGSLASSAALSSSPQMLPPNQDITSLRRHSRPMNVFMETNQSLPRPQNPLPQYINAYDAAYPYLAFSTSLFDHSLRSIYHVLESLKNQLASKEIISEPSKLIVKNYNDEINNSAEETSHVKIVSKDDRNQLGVVDRSILKNVIKESIEEINKDLEQRQAEIIRAKEDNTNSTMPVMPTKQNKTENITTDKPGKVTSAPTPAPRPKPTPTTAEPIATTSKPGYHGGNPQPIHNVHLIHGFPSAEYGYPHHEVHYGPPSAFDHGDGHEFTQNDHHDHELTQNHHEHEFGFGHAHEVFNQDYYHHEPYYGAQEHHSPVDSFSPPTADNWPIYPPYGRAFKFSSKITPKVSNFRPSKLI